MLKPPGGPLTKPDMDNSPSDEPSLSSIEHVARQKQKVDVLESDVGKFKKEIEKLKQEVARNKFRVSTEIAFIETTLERLTTILNVYRKVHEIEKPENRNRFITPQYNANNTLATSNSVTPSVNGKNKYQPVIIKAKL